MKYRINKLELVSCLSIWIALSITLSIAFAPNITATATSVVIPAYTASVAEDVMPMEMLTVNVEAEDDADLMVATIVDSSVNTITKMDEVLPHQVLKKGDAYDEGVVFYASADEIITMTVRADGVKFFENHLVG